MNIEKAKKNFYKKNMPLYRQASICIGEILEYHPEIMLGPSTRQIRYLELLLRMLACGCEDVSFKVLAELGLLSQNDWEYFKELITDEMPDVKKWKQLKKMYRV